MKGERGDILAEAAEEKILWHRFKEGDEKAFEIIFYRYYKKLCHYGYRILPDKEIVKDCVQELFIALWKNRAQLEYTAAINFYLIKSVRGRILRVLNQRKKAPMEALTSESGGQAFIFFSAEDSMLAEQAHQHQHAQLLKALNDLSKRQREVIYLKFFLGLNYDQIAEVMALNYQVTRNYAYQAVKVLRKKLDLVASIAWLLQLLA